MCGVSHNVTTWSISKRSSEARHFLSVLNESLVPLETIWDQVPVFPATSSNVTDILYSQRANKVLAIGLRRSPKLLAFVLRNLGRASCGAETLGEFQEQRSSNVSQAGLLCFYQNRVLRVDFQNIEIRFEFHVTHAPLVLPVRMTTVSLIICHGGPALVDRFAEQAGEYANISAGNRKQLMRRFS